jgi:hypothetical protein
MPASVTASGRGLQKDLITSIPVSASVTELSPRTKTPVSANDLLSSGVPTNMVVKTERDEMTWYKCEGCGMMFDDAEDAKQHEANCDHEDPSYIQ